MWTPTTREKYSRRLARYQTDETDAEGGCWTRCFRQRRR